MKPGRHHLPVGVEHPLALEAVTDARDPAAGHGDVGPSSR